MSDNKPVLVLKESCHATNRQGGMCKLPSVYGTGLCRFHGAMSPQNQAVAIDSMMGVRELALTTLQKQIEENGPLMAPQVLLATVIQLSEKISLLTGGATQRTEVSRNLQEEDATRDRLMEALSEIARKREKFGHHIQKASDYRATAELEMTWEKESVGEDNTVEDSPTDEPA